MKRKHIVAVAAGTLLAGTIAAYANTGWLVTENEPQLIGTEVARGQHSSNYPDASYVAPQGGVAQTVFFDHDPKCDQEAGQVQIVGGDIYPVPTAPFRPGGDCADPVDGLYSSNSFPLGAGDVLRADVGDSSGTVRIYYATNTPTPTPTATATPTVTPTPKASVEPPTEPSRCMSIWTVPELPDAIGANGFVTDIHVTAVNPAGYTLDDGAGVLFFAEQPLTQITIYPERVYRVTVGDSDEGCSLGSVPTGLERGEQPIAPAGGHAIGTVTPGDMPELRTQYFIPSIRR